jgi:hypothetical protein
MRIRGGTAHFGQEHTVFEVVRAMTALVGVRLESPEKRRFKSANVEISHLTMWAQDSGIEQVSVIPESGPDFSTIKVVPIKSVKWRSDANKENVALGWRQRISDKPGIWSRTEGVEESVRLIIEPDDLYSWRDFNDTIQSMQDLLTLAVQSPCLVGARTLALDDDDRFPTEVDLYFESGGSAKVKDRVHQTIFSLADIDYQEVMDKWTDLRSTLGLPLDVLFGLDYNPGIYYENEIFNAASAAEGIHAMLRPGLTGLDPSKHEAIKKRAKEAFDGENYAWVKERINSNRPGLKERFMDLASKPDYNAVKALLVEEEIWARWLKTARNAVGHLNTGEMQKKIPEEAQYRLTYVTKALLHLILLEELGISAELQRNAVRSFFRYPADQFGKEVRELILKERRETTS